MDEKLREYFIEINKLIKAAMSEYKDIEDFKLFIHYVILSAAGCRNEVVREHNEKKVGK